MIISRGRRYIFVHIPKTAGTSMALALEARAQADDILIGDTPKARNRHKRQKSLPARGRLWKHSTLADIDGIVSPQEFEDFCLFTLVRNPWDRIVSYYHWLQAQGFEHAAVVAAKSLTFEAFLQAPEGAQALRRAPAHHYMTDATGVERAAHYVRIEAFDRDIAPIEEHLGFGLVLDHANPSERQADYRAYYSDVTADIVADIASEDITRFGYSF